MDRLIQLVRRPLLVLDEPGFVVEWMSARQPHKADRLTNRLRKIKDKVSDLQSSRRFNNAAYNRRQRDLYHGRVSRGQRMKAPGPAGKQGTKKRTAPEKRLGIPRRER